MGDREAGLAPATPRQPAAEKGLEQWSRHLPNLLDIGRSSTPFGASLLAAVRLAPGREIRRRGATV